MNILKILLGGFEWGGAIIGVLVRVLFITLLERKVLSYLAARKGPNKVGYLGYLQALGDALKLFAKEINHPLQSNSLLYWFRPILSVVVLLGSWTFIYFEYRVNIFRFGVLLIVRLSALKVYRMLGSG